MPPFDEDQRFTGFDSAVNFVSDLALNALVFLLRGSDNQHWTA